MVSLAVAMAAGIAALASIDSIRFCVGLFVWLPRHERWALRKSGRCARCGYDLTANVSGTCPECGVAIDRSPLDKRGGLFPSLRPDERPWWEWAVIAAVMLLAVIVQRSVAPR